MLSKAKIKEIKALEIKKIRDERGLFVAEGDKTVSCMLQSFECETLIASDRWIASQGEGAKGRKDEGVKGRKDEGAKGRKDEGVKGRKDEGVKGRKDEGVKGRKDEGAKGRKEEGVKGRKDEGAKVKEWIIVEADELRKAGFLKTPQDVLAIFRKPRYALEEANPALQLILALDGIQDPGNVGTIIRIAEWFGIEHIVCSPDTADVFSPKTIQATMGALAHVKVHYSNLVAYIRENNASPVYGTFLEGENIYQCTLSQQGIIVMGNEGNGIRPEIEALINKRLHIPSYPSDRKTTGSLNVAAATAIVCAEFRR